MPVLPPVQVLEGDVHIEKPGLCTVVFSVASSGVFFRRRTRDAGTTNNYFAEM